MLGGAGMMGAGHSGGGGPSKPPASAQASFTLSEHRAALLGLYTHFSGASGSLPLAGWMALAEAFDIAPGYLSIDRAEEAYDEAARGRRPAASGAASQLSFQEFQDALCLIATAVMEKQWKARARHHSPGHPATPRRGLRARC